MDFFDQWNEAKWHFSYSDEDQPDKMVLQGGLVIVLYMRKSYLKDNREALANTIQRLHQVMGMHLRWGYWEHPRKKSSYTRERLEKCIDWVRTRPETHVVELTWSSGAGYDFVGDFGMRVFSQMGMKEEQWKDISHFQVYLPVEILQGSGRLAFEMLLHDLVSQLPVLHGYAGLGFQQGNEFQRYESVELELARLFSGFEVADVLGHNELREGIKSVNWYTILNTTWLETLGGRDGLARAIQDETSNGLSLIDYADGVIVKAGEWPSLGWMQYDPQPAAYVAANRILKPVRVKALRCLHMGSFMGDIRFDKVSTDQWLRRFDAPDIWPPANKKEYGDDRANHCE